MFFTESHNLERCSSVFGKMTLLFSSSSSSSGSYCSANTDFRRPAKRFTTGSVKAGRKSDNDTIHSSSGSSARRRRKGKEKLHEINIWLFSGLLRKIYIRFECEFAEFSSSADVKSLIRMEDCCEFA